MTTIAAPRLDVLDNDGVHRLKIELQQFFNPNTVLVVGLGPSAALGLPTMNMLTADLSRELGSLTDPDDKAAWENVLINLSKGLGLEKALQQQDLSDSLHQRIVRATALSVMEKERAAFSAITTGLRPPSIGHILKNLSAGHPIVNVVTSNYDRLIELQSEIVDLGVDVGYPGSFASEYDCVASGRGYRQLVKEGKSSREMKIAHVRVHKPHGSLDWYRNGTSVRRCVAYPLEDPAIIAPGPSKYRAGYEEHFSQQRENAARALRESQRIIAIGYGFNDDQLEQSWCPGQTCDKPLLIITLGLTDNAKQVLHNSSQAIALTQSRLPDPGLTTITKGKSASVYADVDLWSLENFVKEIL